MRKTMGNIVWGSAFIAVGLIIAGNSFGIWNIELFFDGWWTLFIILPCLVSMIQTGFNFGNILGLLIGAMLLLGQLEILDSDILSKLIWPIILVTIGLSILFSGKYWHGFAHTGNANHDGKTSYLAILGAQNAKVIDESYLGGDATAILGGVTLDLRNAVIEQDIVIDVTAILGGVDIFLPPNIKIRLSATPILGGVDDHFESTTAENAPCVTLNCVCVLGGVELK